MDKKLKTINITKDTWLDLKHLQLRTDSSTLNDLIRLMIKIVSQVKGWDEIQTERTK